MNTITMSSLGTMGQWGNQVCQYAFVRTYAVDYHLEYQVPPWGGQYLFGFDDPPITKKLPSAQERTPEGPPHMRGIGVPFSPRGDEYVNRDFVGWAQYPTAYYQNHQGFIKSLYDQPAEPQRSRVVAAADKLQTRGKTLIGLHLRRGDSGRKIFPLTPIEWCLRWLYCHWSRFPSPVLFISTEDQSLLRWFQHYGPVTPEDLGITLLAAPYPKYHYPHGIDPGKARTLDFFPDWYLLQQCDVLLLSDSSFSFTAAWTGNPQEVWRMRLSLRDFEQIDPWNCRFCNMEHLDDHPGIPGTALDRNDEFNWGDFVPTHKAVPEDPETFLQWISPTDHPRKTNV